jgi:hypothetical protein
MKNDYRGLPLFAIETHLNALNEHWIGKEIDSGTLD